MSNSDDKTLNSSALKEFSWPSPLDNRSTCTRAGFLFQQQHGQIFDFFLFACSLATKTDHVRFTAAEALASVNGEHKKIFEQIKKNPKPAFRKLQSFAEYQSEIMVIRMVDNYLAFLSDILQACMLRKPELLSSDEQVRTADIVKFSNRRDLVNFLVDRKINRLSYGGLRGIEKFLVGRLGIPLSVDPTQRTQISVAIELRNIYTHNRGVVNELFLGRLSGQIFDYKFIEGQRFHAGFDEIVMISSSLFTNVVRLDIEVAKKFGLQRKQFSTWRQGRESK